VLAHGVQTDFGSQVSHKPNYEALRGLSLNDFELTDFLGAGAFGKVLLATCIKPGLRITGKKVAVKVRAETREEGRKAVDNPCPQPRRS
jgi:hypothetical protein